MLNEIAISILILIITILYSRYITKYNTDTDLDEYNRIKNYLLNDSSISNKSIIWIHLPYKYNSRQWKSFYSRTSNNLNLPYIYLTVNSILKHNSNYHICLIYYILIDEYQYLHHFYVLKILMTCLIVVNIMNNLLFVKILTAQLILNLTLYRIQL